MGARSCCSVRRRWERGAGWCQLRRCPRNHVAAVQRRLGGPRRWRAAAAADALAQDARRVQINALQLQDSAELGKPELKVDERELQQVLGPRANVKRR